MADVERGWPTCSIQATTANHRFTVDAAMVRHDLVLADQRLRRLTLTYVGIQWLGQSDQRPTKLEDGGRRANPCRHDHNDGLAHNSATVPCNHQDLRSRRTAIVSLRYFSARSRDRIND
jgi:hypothetical protein